MLPAIARTPKASAALIDVAEPLTTDDDDPGTRRNCLVTAMVAWNLSLLPEAERKEQMHRFFEILAGTGRSHVAPHLFEGTKKETRPAAIRSSLSTASRGRASC